MWKRRFNDDANPEPESPPPPKKKLPASGSLVPPSFLCMCDLLSDSPRLKATEDGVKEVSWV